MTPVPVSDRIGGPVDVGPFVGREEKCHPVMHVCAPTSQFFAKLFLQHNLVHLFFMHRLGILNEKDQMYHVVVPLEIHIQVSSMCAILVLILNANFFLATWNSSDLAHTSQGQRLITVFLVVLRYHELKRQQ